LWTVTGIVWWGTDGELFTLKELGITQISVEATEAGGTNQGLTQLAAAVLG
jgi:hypothetical protein